MHYLINLIIEGENRQEVLEDARDYADTLVKQGEFDYGDFHGRWGDSVPYKVTSKKGRELLDKGMQNSRHEFDTALTHARYMLDNYTADEIYEEEFGSKEQQDKIKEANDKIYYLSRYMFAKVDGRDNANYVYANNNIWCGAIENQKSLDHVLNEDKILWVVPVDFHN